HLNRLQMRGEVQDVLGRRDRMPSEPRDPNAPCIRMLRDPSVPRASVQMLHEIIERREVANLLNRQRIWRLVIDDGRQPSDLVVVRHLRLRSRRMAWLEQILDVPRHDLEHRGPLSHGPGAGQMFVPTRTPSGKMWEKSHAHTSNKTDHAANAGTP